MTTSVRVEDRLADDIARLGRGRPLFHNGPHRNIDPAAGPIASQGWIIPSGPDSCPEIMETRRFCVNLQDSGEFGPPSANARWTFEVMRSEEHTSELQSLRHLVCRLLLEKK